MESKLIKIEAKDYGLKETKAKEISKMFKPMLDKMEELESEFNQVMTLEISEDTCKIARKLRLQYRDVRIGTKAIHKDLKSFYLNGGRFVDGWKNAQLMASEGIEDKLLILEKHFEIQRENELAALEKKRLEEINPFLSDIQREYPPAGLELMPQDVWDNYFAGAKANFEAREAATKKAEEERIEEEKRIKEERIEQERKNEVARQENELHYNRLDQLREYYVFTPAEVRQDNLGKWGKERFDLLLVDLQKSKEDYEKKAKLEAEENQKKEREQQKEREQAKAKQDKIDAENTRLKEELKAKEQADRDRIAKEEKEAQSKLNASDKVKVEQLKTDLRAIRMSFKFKSKKNNLMFQGVVLLIDKIINYIEK